MHLLRYLNEVVVWAPAKVNLFLEVRGKRPDGYHDIATLMLAIRLYDTVVLRDAPDGGLHLECYQRELATGPDNLVLRAARLLQERTGATKGCRIRLVKRVPLAAGLAGGSSDAAATLLGLNRLWQLGLSREELAHLGAELGSDVPFFFYAPAAWCTGRGEVVERIPIRHSFELVLLCPRFGMATADVYRRVQVPAAPRSGADLRASLGEGRPDEVGPLLFNRLQAAAEALDGRLTKYAHRLAELRPAGQLLSGSGSTLFALCRSAAEAARLVDELKQETTDYSVFSVRSCV
jgi:4-diphosphocytidyl-2-C-methyl-D-erythritol kinase